jgi:hypothetical protein
MKHKEVLVWVSHCSGSLRGSQQKTIAAAVWAVLHVSYVSIAGIGRSLGVRTGVAAKHAIKRVDRLLSNHRFEPTEGMAGAIPWLSGPSKQLWVSLDWVKVRDFDVLVLAGWFRARAQPLLWHVTRWVDLRKSQNNLEYGLLQQLRAYVPPDVAVTVLADRGFGRAELARLCQGLSFHYVVRIQPSAHVTHERYAGRLRSLPLHPGQQILLRNARYRQAKPVTQSVAVYWHPGEDEPWYLMTDLPRLRPKTLARFYGRRMTIEEYFRDLKSRRQGWGLRMIQIRRPERLARLLLVLAIAYLILLALGRYARVHYPPREYASNNRPNECSYFLLAHWLLDLGKVPPLRQALRELRHDLTAELKEQNWG